MDLTKEDITAMRETHDIVIRLGTLIGNGDSGMSSDIREHTKAITDLYNRHNKLRGRFLLLVGVLGGSGILTGGTLALLEAIK